MEKRGETKELSLQQKVVQIRKRIPTLVKKTYSEEVNYDFVKIDDVYRYLAPAMNDYQVNLEVISETATKKDELENPLFIQYVAQTQMWMYEADLTLRWINAEEPQEADTVVIHAIGSHEFPDKAKGSAWTYAMKYYLLNKFCIDQGGEDPDMRALKTPGTEPAGNDYSEPGGKYWVDGLEAEADMPEAETEDADMSEMEAEESGTPEAGHHVTGRPEVESSEKPKVKKKESAISGQAFRGQKEEAVKEEAAKEEAEKEEKLSVFGEAETARQEKTLESGIPEAAEKQKPAQETALKEGMTDQAMASPKTSSQITPPVSSHIKPESGTMVQLPESAREAMETGSSMTIEEAMQIKCTPGTYSDHTLGSLAQMGEEGIQALIWYAEGYRGRRQELREGARLLLNAAKAA